MRKIVSEHWMRIKTLAGNYKKYQCEVYRDAKLAWHVFHFEFRYSLFFIFSHRRKRKLEIHAKNGSGTACVHNCILFFAKRK